jgi:hypothetical protein
MFKYFLLMLFSGSLLAQTPRADLIRMNKRYANAASFSMKMELYCFENLSDVNPVVSYSGEVKRSKHCYYTAIMGKTMVSDKDHLILVDNKNSTIIYKDASDNKSKQDLDKILDDSTFWSGSKLSYQKLGDGRKVVRATPDNDPVYDYVDIEVNSEGQLLGVDYYVKKNKEGNGAFSRITIKYTNVSIDVPLTESISTSSFVFQKQGKLSGRGKYSNYKIIDQRLKK